VFKSVSWNRQAGHDTGSHMSHEFNIRAVDHNDLSHLLELYRQLHPDEEAVVPAVARDRWEQLLLYPGSSILVGIRGDALVATCTVVVIPNLTRGAKPYALIENVVTDARHRRRGYGKLILEAAMAAAWRHGCYKVMLLTGSKDAATLRFYEEAGFEQSKTGFQARRIPPREG
jgi:GNAT superfamily N-acetyltransferase